MYENLPIVAKTPKNTTETIKNILEDGNNGIEMIIIDEGETKCFWVVSHDTICKGHTEEANQDLMRINYLIDFIL